MAGIIQKLPHFHAWHWARRMHTAWGCGGGAGTAEAPWISGQALHMVCPARQAGPAGTSYSVAQGSSAHVPRGRRGVGGLFVSPFYGLGTHTVTSGVSCPLKQITKVVHIGAPVEGNYVEEFGTRFKPPWRAWEAYTGGGLWSAAKWGVTQAIGP